MTPAPDLAALTKLAQKLAPGGESVAEVKPLSGGASQELWAVVVETPSGAEKVVLRRAPAGRVRSELSTSIELEAELIKSAGARGVPVADVRYVLQPADGLGAGFFMAFVEGEALGQRIVREEKFGAARPKLARQCGEILARIHATPAVVGLPTLQASDVIDALERTHRLEARPRPVMELGFKWLRANLPKPSTPKVVHGDFRNGNLLIGPDGVRAVLDWELAHLGDPLEDLGWICVNSWRFGVIDKPVGGFGVREDLYAGYEAVSGTPVNRDVARFWEVLGTLRWGVMCTLSTISLRDNPNAGIERYMIARRASETELDLIDIFRELM
jgi:aminoglycoside phosphotransferase (APT) family kinase protein